MWRAVLAIALGVALVAPVVFAQSQPSSGPVPPHSRGAMPSHGPDMHGGPSMPGQDAFGAIAEIVKILEADASTDWSKVDLERLRQHLIDMNEVVLHAEVARVPASGGLAMEITGTGRTEQAIRAMVVPHAAELDRTPEWSAKTATIAGGVRLTVVAKKPDDAKLVARIRGLGFAGLITTGAHHQPHHLAMARGELPSGHRH